MEANGLPTVCLGSARDIFLSGVPPRAVFLDYPLGHSAGKPFDSIDQISVVKEALVAFETAAETGSLSELKNRWLDDEWRINASTTRAEDTRQPRDETPQFQYPEDRLAALSEGNF